MAKANVDGEKNRLNQLRFNFEIWKIIDVFPNYAVSNFGRIKRINPHPRWKYSVNSYPGKIINQSKVKSGYRKVNLWIERRNISRNVHCLVALAFLGSRPQGKEINHKDGNKENNIPENLEYVTPKENHRHAIVMGMQPHRYQKGEKHLGAKLNQNNVREIRQLSKSISQRKLAKKYNVSNQAINDILKKKNWAWLK